MKLIWKMVFAIQYWQCTQKFTSKQIETPNFIGFESEWTMTFFFQLPGKWEVQGCDDRAAFPSFCHRHQRGKDPRVTGQVPWGADFLPWCKQEDWLCEPARPAWSCRQGVHPPEGAECWTGKLLFSLRGEDFVHPLSSLPPALAFTHTHTTPPDSPPVSPSPPLLLFFDLPTGLSSLPSISQIDLTLLQIAANYCVKVPIFKQCHKNIIGKGGATIRKVSKQLLCQDSRIWDIMYLNKSTRGYCRPNLPRLHSRLPM